MKKLNNPFVNEYHLYALDIATQNELQQISKMALKINAVLKSFFQRRNLALVEFKLEFGKFGDKVVLADEISPDTCLIWDVPSKKKVDKEAFRLDKTKIDGVYKKALDRIIT